MVYLPSNPSSHTMTPVQLADSTETEHVSPTDITEEDFSSYIAAANTAVSPFDLEIRSTLRQIQADGDDTIVRPERVYALVNTTSDPLTQLATTYTADEIAFVKRLLDAMFETHNTMISEAMVVSGMQAMQLARVSSADAGAGGSRRESMGTQGGAAQSRLAQRWPYLISTTLHMIWGKKLTTVIISRQAAQNLTLSALRPSSISSLYVATNHPLNSINPLGLSP